MANIHDFFQNSLQQGQCPYLSSVTALAAALASPQSKSPTTHSETLAHLTALTADLKAHINDPRLELAISAGADAFQRELVTTGRSENGGSRTNSAAGTAPNGGSRTPNEDVRAAAEAFVRRREDLRHRVVSYGSRFIQDGDTIIVPARDLASLTASGSNNPKTSDSPAPSSIPLVAQFLLRAADAGVLFRVLLVDDMSAPTGTTSSVQRALAQNPAIPAANIHTADLGPAVSNPASPFNMPAADEAAFSAIPAPRILFLLPVEALLSSGGILATPGTVTSVAAARSFGLPVWAISETACVVRAPLPAVAPPMRSEEAKGEDGSKSWMCSVGACSLEPEMVDGLVCEDGPVWGSDRWVEEALKVWY